MVRERIVVEKTVAMEEERIKEVREISEAERLKQVAILDAQAKAEEALVMQVKQAEAEEARAKHKAVEITTLAEAELEAAARQAEAKRKLAEGIEAERAAPGLADARVREVTAAAKEKEGLAEARVMEEKLSAQARGEEAVANTKAKATREVGASEAEVMRLRFEAEAEGLAKKFGTLDSLSDTARAHEEFRMALEKQFDQAIAAIEANKQIARDQAEVLGAALSKAKVEIIGGGGDVFDTFAKGLSLGKAVEGMADKSPVVQDLLSKFIGERGKGAPSSKGKEG